MKIIFEKINIKIIKIIFKIKNKNKKEFYNKKIIIN